MHRNQFQNGSTKQRSRPLKVKSSKKNTSPIKKLPLFLQCFYPEQNYKKYLRSHLLLLFVGSRYVNPHQSPIRIQAYYAPSKCLRNIALAAISAAQKIFSSVSCPIVCFQILWLLANPIIGSRHRRIKKYFEILFCYIFKGTEAANQVL